ncbi:hypothetical protein A3C87_00250 [Candidatus Kaiserbacteria bacterium RIFCSPHIGHO2_02_FULL_49_34]|uniref:Cation/H+ exchanger transmembrane domain-containing protein n=1 Tax=Candidatus Kaiserbacteria bacterium RIFCSPHIGHO2_02_FULL_49_34 TaxID=1798491 RepID=A0A1F6DIY5_9BACT|nr:MAG: hypothetical protein A3C87_00250 [Candidatus Kaiserbacteria bacterium RIFCSPHIGHO2_02_FULL_49_34]
MIESILALILMFLCASGVGVLAERIRVPYTVLLVPVGIILLLASQITSLQFIGSINLTPELLFYAFLPVLIFESAYNINWKQLRRNKWSITLLSVVSLLISTILIAVAFKFGLGLAGWDVPWQVVILFGALISATDPVAVLALFKEYGAPKRLSLIFEGESLFNDGTALALALVLIAAFTATEDISLATMVGEGSLLFVSMVALGAALGAVFGFVFAKLIEKIRDDSSLELTLALVMAHATFISAELLSEWMMHTQHWPIGISPVIATTIGAITMGNWGRYKLSSQVHEFAEHTLGYFGFLINSIIFLLIGFEFIDITHQVDMSTLLVPALIAIAVVVVARAVSVYPVMQLFNKTKLEEHIPLQWQHMLAWGSLRGAIAIAIVLSIPKDWVPAGWVYDFTPQAFIAGITIICIYFTLFIKATTIGAILERFQLTKMTAIEYAGYLLARMRIADKALSESERFLRRGYVDEATALHARDGYEKWKTRAIGHMQATCAEYPQTPILALHLHVAGIEAKVLHRLYHYKEINELVYRRLLGKIEERILDLEESTVPTIATTCEPYFSLFDKIESGMSRVDELRNHYLFARARIIAANKVLEALEHATHEKNLFADDDVQDLISIYTKRREEAKKHMRTLAEKAPKIVGELAVEHMEDGLLKAKERELEEIIEEGVVTPKAAQKLSERILIHRTTKK